MQAMIFAAGMGTRLKPLTDVIPKALVPVGDKPLLQHVMERLQEAGASHVVVNVHHKAGQICEYLRLAEKSYGYSVAISDETESLLETGGGIKKAQRLFASDAPILIHNVDILSNVNLRSLYDSIGSDDALLLVSQRKTKRYLLFSDDMRLVGWTNIETGEVKSPYPELNPAECRMYAFSGIHVFGTTLFSDMDEFPERFPIMDFYLKVCSRRNIRGYVKDDLRLLDVGKLDTLEASESFAASLLTDGVQG